MAYTLVGGDIGNANIKIKTGQGKADFPHALFEMTSSQVSDYKRAGGDSPNVFIVNGKYYSIGEQAVRNGAGAARYGESRYVPEYYGVLASIGMYLALPQTARDICFLGSHTPKDGIYKDDLIAAVSQTWTIERQGVKKVFRPVKVLAADEPSLHYRHATLASGGLGYIGSDRIRRGTCAVLDIGGLTTGIAVADNGKVDYTASDTRVRGILDAIWELERLIWGSNKKLLKGAKVLNPIRLRDALMDGEYDAGGLGVIDCAKEAEEASNLVVSDVVTFFNEWGGSAAFDSLLLAGGGGALLRARLRKQIKHRNIFLTDEHPDSMFMGAAIGAYKTLQLLEAKGKL